MQADSAAKYECSPSPGSSATANVHVITEGEKSSLTTLAILYITADYKSTDN